MGKNTSYTFSFVDRLTIVAIAVYNSIVVHSHGKTYTIIPGLAIVIPKSLAVRIENKNEKEYGSFLIFTLDMASRTADPYVENLTINTIRHTLVAFESLPNVKIASLDARHELIYYNRIFSGRIFVYNLSGAFEASNCLLGPSDGMLLQDFEAVEIEAFEPSSIVLLIEL